MVWVRLPAGIEINCVGVEMNNHPIQPDMCFISSIVTEPGIKKINLKYKIQPHGTGN